MLLILAISFFFSAKFPDPNEHFYACRMGTVKDFQIFRHAMERHSHTKG